MHLRRRHHRQSLRQRLCAACTLVAYLAAALGVPMPAAAVVKDSNQPFPCQDHPCGCRTAEQCWTHCCCFSPEQRWAWAEEHKVQPPSYAEKPAASGWCTARKRDQVKSCCTESRPKTHSCQTCSETKGSHKAAPSKTKGFRWALGMTVLGCQGKTTLWASTGCVLPPSPAVTWTPYLAVIERLSYADEISLVLSSPPREPPPRLAHV